ncbi:hypothetical protein GCM10017781_38190 [Deinococcus metalli]|uniref:Uncharacterized protein n=1 Tax=Deinococcus metalli TaxID=1141878 RepID=A0ABQ3JX77_9DEIO|nr:hypothetical protein GCM10017781_38190 [Deinococcus metalli]
MHDDGVALADEAQERVELGTPGVLARRLVAEDARQSLAVELAIRILVGAADADVADAVTEDGGPPREVSG